MSLRVYVLANGDGAKRFMRSQAAFAVGSCVEVLTSRALLAQASWKYGEASLRASSACTR